MKVIVCTRDLDYGVGSIVKNDLKKYNADKKIEKVILIGPRRLRGYSKKIEFEIIKDFGTYFVTKEPYFAYKCNVKIKEILKKERFDQIDLHFPIYAEDFGTDTIRKVHSLHNYILKNSPKSPKFLIASIFHKFYSYLDYRTLKYSKRISFVSKRVLKEGTMLYPIFREKFHYEPNVIDQDKFFMLNPKEILKLKENLGFQDNKFNILFVGRLEPMKGIGLLIKIIKKIDNPQIRLIIIGEGPLKSEILKYPFVKYIGKVPNEDLYKYYNLSDLLVYPSKNETFGLTLLEAIECGLPCIAFKPNDKDIITASDEIIKDGKTGFLVRDEEEMVIKIKSFFDNLSKKEK